MNALSKLWEKLSRSKKYRDSFAASVAKRTIPLQIRVLRRERGWNQARLATESDLTQGVISRAEDPEYGNLSVNTLIRIGSGFDCAYMGRFVPFSELSRWYSRLDNETDFLVPSFADDVLGKPASAVGVKRKRKIRSVNHNRSQVDNLVRKGPARSNTSHPSSNVALSPSPAQDIDRSVNGNNINRGSVDLLPMSGNQSTGAGAYSAVRR